MLSIERLDNLIHRAPLIMFGVGFLAIAIVCEFGMMKDALRGAPKPVWTVVLDFAMTLQFQWLIVRALLSVVVYNRRLTS